MGALGISSADLPMKPMCMKLLPPLNVQVLKRWDSTPSPLMLDQLTEIPKQASLSPAPVDFQAGFETCRTSFTVEASSLVPTTTSLLKNKAIIEVNQDPAALPPHLVYQVPPFGSPQATTLNITAQVFARPLSGSRLAVLLLNRGSQSTNLSASWDQLGLPAGQSVGVYDVIGQQAAGTAVGSFSAEVPSHDVAFD